MHICIHVYLCIHMHTHTERGELYVQSLTSVSQASLKLCCSGCPEQSYFFRLTSTGITAISFFSPLLLSNCFVSVSAQMPQGKHLRKQVILGYQAVGKCLGKWAFLSVLREGEKRSHCPEKRTWQLRPSRLLLQGDVVLACVLLLW